jgi:hypothetical protein
MPKPSQLATLSVGKEASGTPGTAAAPTMWLPWKTLTPKDDVNPIEDSGQRAAPVDIFGLYPGQKGAELDLGGDVFADSIGFPLVSVLPDVTVTGTPTGSGSTTLSSSTIVGATSLSTVASIPAATVVQIGTGVTAEIATTGTPSGAGPYTIPLTLPAGGLLYAHASAQAVVPLLTAPNSTAFSTLCSGDTQPPTQTWTIDDPLGTWQYAGAQFSELGFKWNADGLLEWSGKATTWGYVSGSKPTASFGSVAPVANWATVTKIAGTNTFVQDGEITIKRAITAIRGAAGTQNPYRIWSGDVAVEGKATLVMENSTQRTNFQAGTVQAFETSYSQGSGLTTNGLTLHCSQVVFTEGTPSYGKDYIELPVTFRAIGNATDIGASGGYSPIKATLANAIASGTYK